MAIPRAVQEAADRADALMKSLNGNTGEEPTPEVKDETVVAEAAAEPAPPEPVAAPADDSWEIKYKVLAGKYSAEVPRMAEQIRELKDEIRALSERKPEPSAPVIPSKITPAEVVEKFGEDFAEAVGSLAAQIAEQRTSKLREEFAPQIERATDTAVKSVRAEFIRELTAVVPNWKAIDQEGGFTAFLDEVDPMSGRPRRDFFNEADRSNDASRIARFFTTYAGNKSPAPAKSAVPPLEQSIAPASSRNSPTVPTGKRFWTTNDIRGFYAAARRNAYSPEEYRRIESDIFAAQKENRVAA